MQEFMPLAIILREISFGILLVGLFYTFGMFLIGRLFAAISEHAHEHDVSHEAEHDIDHHIEHDVEHDYDHDVEHDIEHAVEHDYDTHVEIGHDVDHEIEHDVEHDIDHHFETDVAHEVDHEIEHDVEHDIDHHIEHDVEHDIEHDVEHDVEHHIDTDHEADHDTEHDTDHEHELDHDVEAGDHSGYFEAARGAPLGVTIGTSLVSFGFLGSIVYYEGLLAPLAAKICFQFIGAALLVFFVRTVLGKVFVESGFNIAPKHIVGQEVEAVSTINDDFGEVRYETEMGLRRFHARPLQQGLVFRKGMTLYVVSANDKFVFVDPRIEVAKGQHKQSQKLPQ
jgi:hypothetical protein